MHITMILMSMCVWTIGFFTYDIVDFFQGSALGFPMFGIVGMLWGYISNGVKM
jgi:hypothetical protein